MSAAPQMNGWAPWHPKHGFHIPNFYEGAIAFADLCPAGVRLVKDLNGVAGTSNVNGWRLVKATFVKAAPEGDRAQPQTVGKGIPPTLPSGWTTQHAAKAAWMINTLAVTPPDEWRTKAELYETLAEFRALSLSRPDREGGK